MLDIAAAREVEDAAVKIIFREAVIIMPRFDGTGPMGMGPGTGRGMGPCGAGRGFGFGTGYYGCPAGYGRRLSRKSEKEILEDELEAIEEEKEEIRARLEELKAE